MKNLKTSDSIYELHLEDLIESSSLLSADLFPGRGPTTAGELRSVDHHSISILTRKLISMRV